MRTTFGRFAALAAIAALLSVSLTVVAAEGDRASPQKAAAAKEGDKQPASGSQQNRMKTCNAEAAKKSLKGDERKAFMSACLKN